MKVVVRLSALIALLSFASVLAIAQGPTGSVAGNIKDQTGAVVPNAKVTITNPATGFTRTETSSGSGSYAFSSLPPATYNLTAEAQGFTTGKSSVQVTIGSNNAVDIALGVAGTGNTVVEVVGEGGVAVNIQDQTLSSVVNSQQIAQLPTLTRNPYDLVATAGNVQEDKQAGMGDNRGAGFSINGQRSASTSILLDGAENVDLFTAGVGQQVPQDSVQEFRVVSNGMTAEYGRASGGVVNVATKSGTNNFHGSAYEFNRISALASNTYFNAASDIPKAVFTRNQFGYSVGGPIVKNKLFFFNNTEWIRVRSPAPQFAMVPDPSMIAAASPNTQAFFAAYGKLRPDVRVLSTTTTPGGFLLDKVTYNAPSDAGAGAPQNTLMTVGRVDVNISDRTSLFGRYSLFDENDQAGFVNTSPYVGFETGQKNFDNNFEGSLTHTFGSALVSNSRIIYNRLNNQQPLGAAPVGPTLYVTNSSAARVGGVHVALPGYNEYTPGNAIPFGGPQNLGQAFEDLSWIKGNHTFKFGGQYIYVQDNRVFGAYEEAVEALATSSAATGFGNFLSGNLQLFQAAVYPQGKFPCKVDLATGSAIQDSSCQVTLPVGPPSFSRSNRYNDGAAYVQDSWKVRPRLTLNLGVRWEYYGVQHNKNPNLDSNFYYGSGNNLLTRIRNGAVMTAPQSPTGSLWAPQYKNFGPRVGFAYDLFGDGKTALRGGYGISYERNFGNVTFNVIQNPPNYAVLSIQPADVGGNIPVTTNNAGPLAGNTGTKFLPPVSLRAVDPNIDVAPAHQWNLSLERQFAANNVLTLSYNGSRGLHQYGISNINDLGFGPLYLGDATNLRLNPQYGSINFRDSKGDSYYHGLTAQARGSSHNLQYTFSYTWSHAIDTLSSTFSDEVVNNGLGYVDPFNAKLDKGSSDYDARHRVSVSLLVDEPWFKNSRGIVRALLGGFQFAPIFTYHTGYPFSVFDCTNSFAAFNCPRADITPGAALATSGSPGSDLGGDTFDYLTVPAAVGEYAGPTVIPGTNTPFPYTAAFPTASNLPTCTGLFHQGCSFPSNMLGRNAFRAPSVWDWTLGAYKNFKVTERVNLQLRGEFFNILNHKNFYVVGFPLGGADVSTSTTVQAMKGGYGNPFDDHRNTQLALRVTF